MTDYCWLVGWLVLLNILHSFITFLLPTQVIKNLTVVYSNATIPSALDRLCRILYKLTFPRAGAISAVMEWHVMEAFRVHLPTALSAIGSLGIEDELY